MGVAFWFPLEDNQPSKTFVDVEELGRVEDDYLPTFGGPKINPDPQAEWEAQQE
ncbi:hypothetical protein [Deinococcus misasensis]|uniref:hypothetical protein n=1 Tax=Deinococcus misasensis TaxID=392413 RepID=UPI000A849C75|nr:hypothetical protein [Deinococcus misasensis]